jgi:flagellar hook-length control protein FliK
MTPSLSIAPMPVANTSAPSAAPATNSAANAPASVAVDFMAMLGQLSVAPAPANAAAQASATLPAWKELQDAETKEPESTDVVGMMPLSLPVMPMEMKGEGAELQTMLAVTATVAKAEGAAIAPEAQLLTDLIQPEQSGQPKFEIPHLTTTSTDVTSPTRPAEAAYARPVHTPVGTPGWSEEIGSRLTMMVEQGKHTASLRLSPEHLGPLEIQISMNDDQASVYFGAANADTRAALENALPKLREMFASQGLSLADAGVHREPPRQQPNPAAQSPSSGDFAAENGSEQGLAAAHVRLGLLDAYA